MVIKIDASPNGYKLILEMDNGKRHTYPREIHSYIEASKYAEICADEWVKEFGVKPESITTYEALEQNRHRDIHARMAWDRLRSRGEA